MSLFHIISYPLFLIAAMEITLGIILLRSNHRKSNAQRAVAALSFFSAAFSLTSAVMYVRASLGLSIDLAARINWIGWFTVPAALQILHFLKDDRGRAGYIIGAVLYPVWLAIYWLCLFTDLIVAPGYSVIPFINHPGPYENPARLFGSLLAVWLLWSTVRLKKELHGIRRVQLNYFFHGVLIFGGGAAFTAGFLQIFGGFGFEPGLASFFSFPWVALTYYAITRHRLFDIRIIFTRFLSVILLVALFSLTQIELLKLLTPELGESFSILISLSIIGGIFYGTRIYRRLHRWVQYLVLQDKYDYQGVLRESIKAVTTILDLDPLLDYIVGTMKKSLGVERAYLILKDKSGVFSGNHGRPANDPACAQGNCLKDLLAAWVVKNGASVVREELGDAQSREEAAAYEEMKAIAAELIVPLLSKGDIKGFLVLGEKGNQEPYLQSDIDLLESLAGHASVAIENAQLYEEARQAKGSMRESESKFQTLAETAAMGIFMHQGGNFLYANRAAEVIGGYSVSEYLKMDFLSLVHPDFADLVKRRARERLSGNSVPGQYEFKLVRKNGEERWVLMTAGISEFDGKPTVIGTLVDINARKQAEEERERYYQELQEATHSLQESEAKFRSLAETAPAVIFIHQGGKFLYANAASISMIGYSREEFLTMDFWSVTHPDDREMIIERGRSRFSGNQAPQRYEFRIMTKSGEVRWLDMTVAMIEYEGKPAVLGSAFDITLRKEAEDEREKLNLQLQQALRSLQESEAKFRTLAETTTAAIFIHQGQKLVYANPAGTAVTGYTNEELLQEDFWALIHPDYQEMVRERGQAGIGDGNGQKDHEYKFIKKNGDECWVSMTAGFIEFGGKPAIIATLFDITDWKRAEEAKVKFYEESVRQYQERIEEEKRYRLEKEKILMDLHDGIGGITTNISILSELAQNVKNSANAGKLLSTISQLSREGIAEIRGFMHSLDSKDLNWRTMAAELRKQGANMVETHDIKFSIQIEVLENDEQPGSLTWVNMFKIYKEALTNVVKHSRATVVSVWFVVTDQGVRLSVHDNGVGVDGSGTGGRGLSNMKTRAKDIGGMVTVVSEQGTVVHLELPLPLKYPAGGMVIQ